MKIKAAKSTISIERRSEIVKKGSVHFIVVQSQHTRTCRQTLLISTTVGTAKDRREGLFYYLTNSFFGIHNIPKTDQTGPLPTRDYQSCMTWQEWSTHTARSKCFRRASETQV